jgi:molybdate transport system permease protein
MTVSDCVAALLTFKLAAFSTVILLCIGVPLGWWLARSRSPAGHIVGIATILPLALPPSVLGFYLLFLFGPEGAAGRLCQALHLPPMVFSFHGLLTGAIIASLPFVVQPIRSGFAAQGNRYMEAAAVLRARPLDAFFTIAVPMNRTGILTAAILGFVHTIGEFGVMLMIGGSIPGKTLVLSIAIFNHVEAMEYGRANVLSLALAAFVIASLALVYVINRPGAGRHEH